MQLRKTLTHSSGQTLEGKTVYRLVLNLSIHVIECVFIVNKSMQLRKTLTHSSGQTLEGKTVYRLVLNLSIHVIECVFICKQINAVKEDFNS